MVVRPLFHVFICGDQDDAKFFDHVDRAVRINRARGVIDDVLIGNSLSGMAVSRLPPLQPGQLPVSSACKTKR